MAQSAPMVMRAPRAAVPEAAYILLQGQSAVPVQLVLTEEAILIRALEAAAALPLFSPLQAQHSQVIPQLLLLMAQMLEVKARLVRYTSRQQRRERGQAR